MIEILPAAPHVAAFRFEGELSGEDYDACIAAVEDTLARHRRIAVFCDMRGFTRVSAVAAAKDLRYSLSKIGEYSRFARGAIVTDKRWLAAITGFVGRFFPHSDVRSFQPEEHDRAFAWAAEPLPADDRPM